MTEGTRRKVLVVTLDAYRFSTRARKASGAYAASADVTFLGLSGAGRTGRWDEPRDTSEAGLRIKQVKVRRPSVEPTRWNMARNVLVSYAPALVRMAVAVLRAPADVVHVTGAPLAPLGVLHRLRFHSSMVLDIQERPGAVSSAGSLTGIFSKVEPLVLRIAARHAALATVVTAGDVATVEDLGFRDVRLVRNAPVKSWRAPYTSPVAEISTELRLVAIGTIFEGRGYEILLHAIARVASERPVHLTICGPGRPRYLEDLKQLTESLGISCRVDWLDPVPASEVSQLYLSGHVGIVLYEPADPGNDGLSNKILECVASGRPVLAGDLPENRRFVQENAVGWLTEVTEAGIARVLADLDEDMDALCARCRDHGDTWLNWEAEFADVLSAALPAAAISRIDPAG